MFNSKTTSENQNLRHALDVEQISVGATVNLFIVPGLQLYYKYVSCAVLPLLTECVNIV